ncbi:MAG TPA: tRNA (adenosine(37)-N6)-dimethylallyltransferase MiaA [Thermoanaerobaculia bacterium]|nr:tRNA (adenosine(37)-N6)-dimethylallyltransferase MiaA [Thermoanaerobaculia bacterium]
MKVVVIAGPTAVGKSELAVRLAVALGGEIVNFDSVQIYKGFDIGSAKPSPAERAAVPHHLLDIVEPTAEFTAAEYARLAAPVCEEIAQRGRRPILVGGTFFYLRALLSGLPEMPPRDDAIRLRLRRISDRPRGPARLHRWLRRVDPVSAGKLAVADRHRVERALEVWLLRSRPISDTPPPSSATPDRIPAVRIALALDRQRLNETISTRVEAMYSAGLVEETRALLSRYPPDARPFASIGYKEAAAIVCGELSPEAGIEETKRRTRAYAKRQMTWLRSERNVHWLDAADREKAFEQAVAIIEGEH